VKPGFAAFLFLSSKGSSIPVGIEEKIRSEERRRNAYSIP
jgi:hypothetical protein